MIAAPSPLREKQVARSSPVTPHAAATTIVHRNDDLPLAPGTKRAAETLPCSLPKRKIVTSSSGCGGGDDQLHGKEEEVDQSQTNEIVGKFNRLVKQYTQLEKDFVKLQRKHNEVKANTVRNVLAPKSVEREVNDKYGTSLGIDPGVLQKPTEYSLASQGGSSVLLSVFLIGLACDKPAQSDLVLSGANDHHTIRVFPLPSEDEVPPRLRSNETYDEAMIILEFQRNKIVKKTIEMRKKEFLERKGHLGPCSLRNLKYIDIGKLFLFDSLHTLYHGVLDRLLTLWFDVDYKKEDWSVRHHIDSAADQLLKIRYPSTTTRAPRSLLEYTRYKGSEQRCILLFGFIILKRFLKKEYYEHLLLLVVASYLAEGRELHHSQIQDIELLIKQFLDLFPYLYSNRHIVQNVHSLCHLQQSLQGFGSLALYSKFNFENVLVPFNSVKNLGGICYAADYVNRTDDCNPTACTPFATVKGRSWGEGGYIRILRGKNMCSIASYEACE
ncbi:unnamed protein product [Didymodactylos carnosus]|uniref:Uncharacterized protein n=1 Tax=Didymodactylos carnosus TaxID=1234261 RepID=A0A8S2D134_9BILA|nr:unnamed protein product [Didymodactylos carnosus]CAF3570005.1 unnamed protein product [Didymodactylos carnosus]